MLHKTHRLTDKKDIDQVFRRGKVVSGGDIIIKYLPSGSSAARVAVLVGKKLVKKAPRRNRIRRRLREGLRLNIQLLPAGMDLLVIARSPKLFDKPFPEILSLISTTLRKISPAS